MVFSVNDKKYRVHFRYNYTIGNATVGINEGEVVRLGDLSPVETECVIEEVSDTVGKVTSAIAYCNPKDNFNRVVGRKVAFAKALKIFDKETRSKFWESYKTSGIRYIA